MSASQQQSDAELLRLMLAGDEEAFTALYRRRQGGVYRFALQMSGSEALAEDVVQETFIVLMRSGAVFDPARGSVAAFLYGIARNHVLRAFDRERALVRFDEEAEEGGELPHENLVARPDPLGDLTRAESVEKLRQAVLAVSLVAAKAAGSPTATPATTSTNDSRRTIIRTSRGCAPSARRMPISFVRPATP